MDHHPRQTEGLNALLVEPFPIGRTAEVASLGVGLRCRKSLGAVFIQKRVPIRQPRALYLPYTRDTTIPL